MLISKSAVKKLPDFEEIIRVPLNFFSIRDVSINVQQIRCVGPLVVS